MESSVGEQWWGWEAVVGSSGGGEMMWSSGGEQWFGEALDGQSDGQIDRSN